MPAGFAVLYQYLLDKVVHTTRKFCTVACSCLGKTMQMLVTDMHLVYLMLNCPQACVEGAKPITHLSRLSFKWQFEKI